MSVVKHIAPRLAWFSLLGALGCNEPITVFDSLVGSEEAAITGTLVTPEGPPSEPVRAAVVWNHYGTADGPAETAAQSALVDAAFPAAFTMSIGSPPLEAILAGSLVREEDRADEPRLGYGLIVALRDDGGAQGSPFERVVGGCVDHVVVYAEADMQPGTKAELLMHGRLAKGFHLLRVLRNAPDCYGPTESQSCYDFRLEPAPDGFATSVEIELTTKAVLGLQTL